MQQLIFSTELKPVILLNELDCRSGNYCYATVERMTYAEDLRAVFGKRQERLSDIDGRTRYPDVKPRLRRNRHWARRAVPWSFSFEHHDNERDG